MFGAAAASSSAASTGFGFGATSGASSAGASTGFGFGASKPGAGSSAASTGFGGFGAAASSAAASAPAASTGLSFGAAAGSAAGTAPAASSAGAAAAAAAAAAGHHHASSAPAYRRFQRVAQQWDFASEHLQRTAPGAAGESALAKALAEALRANNRPAVPPNNHITQQRLAQLGFVHPAGGMMGGAMAAQRGSGVFHAVRAIFLARSAFACGLANPQITTVQLDDHVEEFGPAGPVFDWPIRPNTVTHYRHIL